MVRAPSFLPSKAEYRWMPAAGGGSGGGRRGEAQGKAGGGRHGKTRHTYEVVAVGCRAVACLLTQRTGADEGLVFDLLLECRPPATPLMQVAHTPPLIHCTLHDAHPASAVLRCHAPSLEPARLPVGAAVEVDRVRLVNAPKRLAFAREDFLGGLRLQAVQHANALWTW